MRSNNGTVATAASYCPTELGIYDHAVYIIAGRFGCDGRVAQPVIVRTGNAELPGLAMLPARGMQPGNGDRSADLDMGGKVAVAIEMGHGDDDIGEIRALWRVVLI